MVAKMIVIKIIGRGSLKRRRRRKRKENPINAPKFILELNQPLKCRYLERKPVMTPIEKAIRNSTGISPKNAPIAVFIPSPPSNLRNTDQQ